MFQSPSKDRLAITPCYLTTFTTAMQVKLHTKWYLSSHIFHVVLVVVYFCFLFGLFFLSPTRGGGHSGVGVCINLFVVLVQDAQEDPSTQKSNCISQETRR
uniref:Uncharacterized protein n=1 Tax=Rhizophora mucronata TaxID=61149 RepID=A0A2P2IHN1_RHIMU